MLCAKKEIKELFKHFLTHTHTHVCVFFDLIGGIKEQRKILLIVIKSRPILLLFFIFYFFFLQMRN